MLRLEQLLLAVTVALFVSAAAVVAYDLWFAPSAHRRVRFGAGAAPSLAMRCRTSAALVVVAWMPLLIALAILAICKSASAAG